MSHPGEAVGRLPPVRAMREAVYGLRSRVQRAAGGAPRFKVIVLFAGVMALDTADIGTVGAVAPQLERSLHISNTQVGLIAAVSALAGAVGTLPVGLLTDRTHRINLLSASIVLWSAALIGCAVAPSFAVWWRAAWRSARSLRRRDRRWLRSSATSFRRASELESGG